MNFLLFFMSGVFSFMFYTFYKYDMWESSFWELTKNTSWIESMTGNLFIESLVFLLLAMVLFLYFSHYSFFPKNKEEVSWKSLLSSVNLLKDFSLSIFFKKYMYYIWFVFFYFAIYMMLKSFWMSDFSYFMVFLNILMWALFFMTKKSELFSDFISMNTILFSLYYMFFYIFGFMFPLEKFLLVDVVNTLFLFVFFTMTFYADSKMFQSKNVDSVLILYFFLYSFMTLCFYAKHYFELPGKEFLYALMYIGFIFNTMMYFVFQKLKFFQSSMYILSALSFLFLYISSMFWMSLLVTNGDLMTVKNIFVLSVLLYSIVFNYVMHKKFQNYVSFFFSLFMSFFLIYYWMYKVCIFNDVYFLKWEMIISFFIPLSLVAATYMYKQKYSFDYYFLHICWYLVNFLWMVYYFTFVQFELLDLWLVLFLDSILIFLSYFSLKKLSN